nr:M56 family metallopeptidase [Aneurinibacillus sp. XH2]
MLTRLFTDFLIISVTTSLVILGLKLASPLLHKNYTARWKYWVWMIVAIRLLFPFHFSFATSLVQINVPEYTMIGTVFQGSSPSNAQENSTVATQNELPGHAVEPLSHMLSVLDILSIIWMSGLVLFLLYHFIGYFLYRKQALRWSRPILNQSVTARIKQAFNEMNVKSSVTVLTSEKVPNPMLVGFLKPVLFLPHENYTNEELEFIVKHELVHFKRFDIGYKLLLLIVQAIHWFNPFVWLMVREAGREIEMYCDETVVRGQSLTYRKRYCEAILSAMQDKHIRPSALSTNFAGGKHTMKQRFKSILSMKKKRSGLTLFCTVILTLGMLAAFTNVTNGSSASFKPGTIYSSLDGKQVVSYDAGNSYSINAEGNVSISYRNGEVTAKTPLKVDMTRESRNRGISESGFFISEDKTAIVYNPQPDKLSPLHVLISDDMGRTWNDIIVQGARGNELFIGFTSKKDGWMVSGHSRGVGSALNYVFQTSDGGKTWEEVGNPNDVYSEHLTAAGFANKDIGFLGFRYYSDYGPVIYWTKDRGQSWARLPVSLPEKFDEYRKNPLSPIFNGKEGLFPIAVKDKELEDIGTIYLTSKDGGLTWVYDESYDKLKSHK